MTVWGLECFLIKYGDKYGDQDEPVNRDIFFNRLRLPPRGHPAIIAPLYLTLPERDCRTNGNEFGRFVHGY